MSKILCIIYSTCCHIIDNSVFTTSLSTVQYFVLNYSHPQNINNMENVFAN